jgi:peptidyl-prolyl cis-trans isomerase A (cyclophilin A)
MSNPVIGAIKDQKKILLYLIGFVVVIVFGLTYQSKQSFDFGFSNSYPGYSSSNSNNNSGSSTVVNSKYNKYSSAPIMKLKNGVDYWATIETSAGIIEIDLFEKDTPVTVNNFVFLANDNYYDDLIFHYIKKGTLIQGGDPLGDSSGGPGYKFKDEIDAEAIGLGDVTVGESTFLSKLYDQFDEYTAPYSPENLSAKSKLTLKEFYEQDFGYTYSNGIGTHKLTSYMVAMANGGPNTNGSQFFITTEGFNDKSLAGMHTVFAKVTSGFEVVDKIEAVSLTSTKKPVKDVVINSVTIHEY